MDLTYECMNIWEWLKFMDMMDIVSKAGINPFFIVEMPTAIHVYEFNEAAQEMCHIKGIVK